MPRTESYAGVKRRQVLGPGRARRRVELDGVGDLDERGGEQLEAAVVRIRCLGRHAAKVLHHRGEARQHRVVERRRLVDARRQPLLDAVLVARERPVQEGREIVEAGRKHAATTAR